MNGNDIVFSDSTILGYCITAFIYLALPVASFFIMRKYNSAKLLPMIAGIITYFLATRLADGAAYLMLPAAPLAQKAAISTEIVCITEKVGRWLLRAVLLHYLLNGSVWLASFSGIPVLSKLTGIIVGTGIIIYVFRLIDGRSFIDDIIYPQLQSDTF
ncbi:hypothetical protein [Ruminococcus sp.]|jgi:hypothetical protein|uniref:hypothetical protein n=1 Tax=Ruminococcus sp. TaxID=41978 RepID=UPI0025E73244|nr:hypothetical protein [Ruminococcus sp.]